MSQACVSYRHMSERTDRCIASFTSYYKLVLFLDSVLFDVNSVGKWKFACVVITIYREKWLFKTIMVIRDTENPHTLIARLANRKPYTESLIALSLSSESIGETLFGVLFCCHMRSKYICVNARDIIFKPIVNVNLQK